MGYGEWKKHRVGRKAVPGKGLFCADCGSYYNNHSWSHYKKKHR